MNNMDYETYEKVLKELIQWCVDGFNNNDPEFLEGEGEDSKRVKSPYIREGVIMTRISVRKFLKHKKGKLK